MEKIIITGFELSELTQEFRKIVQEENRKLLDRIKLQEEHELLTMEEACKMFDISRPTLIKYYKTLNVVRYHQKGTRIFFVKSELIEDLSKYTKGARTK
jgi:hypothetical protein